MTKGGASGLVHHMFIMLSPRYLGTNAYGCIREYLKGYPNMIRLCVAEAAIKGQGSKGVCSGTAQIQIKMILIDRTGCHIPGKSLCHMHSRVPYGQIPASMLRIRALVPIEVTAAAFLLPLPFPFFASGVQGAFLVSHSGLLHCVIIF